MSEWSSMLILTEQITNSIYVRVGILLTCGKSLHDHIISVRGEIWTHKTSLTTSFLNEVSVPNQESEW